LWLHRARLRDLFASTKFEPKEAHTLALVAAFSPVDAGASATAGTAALYLAMSAQRLRPTHALMLALDRALGGQGAALATAHRGAAGAAAWTAALGTFHRQLLRRTGLTPEELYSEGRGLYFTDADACAAAVNRATAELRGLRVDKDTVEYAVGPVDGPALALTVASLGQVAVESARADRDVRASKEQQQAPHAAVALAVREGTRKGPLHRYLVEHHLVRAVVGHDRAMAQLNAQTALQLRSMLMAVAQPVLVAVKDAPTLREVRSEDLAKGFPPRRPPPAATQYAVAARVAFSAAPGQALVPGVAMELLKAVKVRGGDDDDALHTFLAWKFQSGGGGGGGGGGEGAERAPPALVAAVTRLGQQLAPLQRDLAAIVHAADGVAFAGEGDGAGAGAGAGGGLLLAWDERWQPLRRVVDRHGGLFRVGRLDSFRLLATRLLEAVMELGDRGVVMRALSPSTVIVDEAGTHVRLLLLPAAYDADQHMHSARAAAVPNEDALVGYMEQCRGDDTRAACLPHHGVFTSKEGLAAAQGAAWDVWSFGATLFIMAFGRPPAPPDATTTTTTAAPPAAAAAAGGRAGAPEDQKGSGKADAQGDGPAAAASLLLRLMTRMLEGPAASASGGGDVSVDGAVLSAGQRRALTRAAAQPSGRRDAARRLLTADALHVALGKQSRALLFSLLQETTGKSAEKLAAFRGAFCAEAPTCGLTDRAAELVWERMVQGMFARLSAGAGGVKNVADRLSRPPKDLTEDRAMAFAAEVLGLTLTKQEFRGLVNCFNDSKQRERPFVDCAKRMLKAVGGLLDEVQWYGCLQQVLYVCARCMSADPAQRPKAADLRRLVVFGLATDEGTLTKVAVETKALVAPFATAERFVSEAFCAPLGRLLGRLCRHTEALRAAAGTGAGGGAAAASGEAVGDREARIAELQGLLSGFCGLVRACFDSACIVPTCRSSPLLRCLIWSYIVPLPRRLGVWRTSWRSRPARRRRTARCPTPTAPRPWGRTSAGPARTCAG